MKILVSWIGHTDLRALAIGRDTAERKRIAELVRGDLKAPEDGQGPLKTMVSVDQFDEIHLLADIPEEMAGWFVSWLGQKAVVHKVDVHGPTNYREIFEISDRVLSEITSPLQASEYEMNYLLSPGTPTMAAVWVLLGKTKYPGRFWQTWAGKATEAEIPFDLTLDVVPRLLRGADRHFQHLTTRGPAELEGFEQIIGDSPAIRLAAGRAKKASLRDVPVLLNGESGTGKEMFAHAIHAASPRRKGPFIPINCAALPKALLESELFGHVKGAFTGADKDREGAFSRADGGTLLLDEVGECDPEIQAKLLRVLQPPPGEASCVCEFSPVGSSKILRTNVRVISATNRSLAEMVTQGDFREDLYYRLAVITLKLPPLRERAGDVLLISEDLLKRINQEFERQEPGYRHKKLSESAKYFVKAHSWPGNVRELYNTLLQAAVMSEAEALEDQDLQAAVPERIKPEDEKADLLEKPLGKGFDLDTLLESVQKQYLQRAMHEANGVKTRAADLLGYKNYQTLDAQLKRLNVVWEK